MCKLHVTACFSSVVTVSAAVDTEGVLQDDLYKLTDMATQQPIPLMDTLLNHWVMKRLLYLMV